MQSSALGSSHGDRSQGAPALAKYYGLGTPAIQHGVSEYIGSILPANHCTDGQTAQGNVNSIILQMENEIRKLQNEKQLLAQKYIHLQHEIENMGSLHSTNNINHMKLAGDNPYYRYVRGAYNTGEYHAKSNAASDIPMTQFDHSKLFHSNPGLTSNPMLPAVTSGSLHAQRNSQAMRSESTEGQKVASALATLLSSHGAQY